MAEAKEVQEDATTTKLKPQNALTLRESRASTHHAQYDERAAWRKTLSWQPNSQAG